MKTQELLNVLKENEGKALLFEYQSGQYVEANYHITEVKNTVIHSVDCGGRADQWNETVIQLWESPEEIGKTDYLKTDKAFSIFNRVDAIHPMDRNALVKFEYGNNTFHKANLEINDVETTADTLIFKLFVSQTDCKAKDDCGVPETALATTSDEGCCSGSNCC